MLKWGSKMRPPFFDDFWSRVGGRGGPTRESKASQVPEVSEPVPVKKHARSSLDGRRRIYRLTPLPPSSPSLAADDDDGDGEDDDENDADDDFLTSDIRGVLTI